ncbi:MAG: efflux transporter outer membrane subunit [Gammaproteobacteria bacterium]
MKGRVWPASIAALQSVVTILPLTLLLAGCTVGPDFIRPQADTPNTWTTALSRPVPTREWASAVSARPIESAAWWTTFQDPLLSSLIERAIAANLDLRQATLRIAEARTLRDVSAARQWPSLSANSAYSRQRISGETATGAFLNKVPGLPNPADQFQYGFDASWEIDLFGRIRRSVEAADADTQTSVEDRSDVLVTLFGEVARNYIELRSAQLRQAITTENLRSQRDVLDFTRDRQRSGIGNDLDVSNAAAQVATTEAQLPALENQIIQSINALSLLLAREPGALHDELQLTQPVPPVPPEVPIGLPADLVRRRADIRGAEAQLHAATARVGVAVADLFPRLTLDAQVGFQALRFPNLTNWASRFVSVGPNLDLPILDGGRRQATLRLEGVREQEAAVNYARTVLAALHEVENALIAYSTEQSRRASLEVAVAQSRDALTLARARYASGITNFLDVLDAERNLQQTELSLADSTAAVSIDLVALYKALGGGWEAHVTTSATGP